MKLNLNHASLASLVLALSLNLSAAAAREGNLQPAAEPDFKTASGWWADLWNIWTPVGWKDHLHRFNVLWNGTVLAKPDMNRRSGGQGLQLALTPDYEEWARNFKADKLRQDDHKVRQGWNNDEAPVLWSEWSKNGWLIRSEVFAHIPGGGDVQTGNEPLFLWLRLRVHDPGKAPPAEKGQNFDLILQAPHLSTEMTMWNNVHFTLDQARYPRPLRPENGELDPVKGFRVLEADSKVRLAVAPGGDSAGIVFSAAESDQPWCRLQVKLPAKKGAHVDVLLPMVSGERPVVDAEMALGYEAALSETRRYWQKITACPTFIEVPETAINDCIRQSVRFSNLLTEKNPATGKYCKVNGSWTYADLWATPGSMDMVMLMDTLGYHRMVEQYLSIFLEEQGTVKPPGPAYELHRGYFSTPALYKSIDWLSDNGAVLYTLAMHALLSGDQEFIARSTGGLIRSCEWIADARRQKNRGGYEGVLPPAVATDNQRIIQGVWSIGWNYKGLCAAVRLFQQIKHPRAAEFAREAEAYKTDFVKALQDKRGKAPVWRDSQGNSHAFVPTTLAGEEEAETRHAFYLDAGPLFLVFAGLLEAGDPMMQDTCAYFRAGPQHQAYRHDTSSFQPPVLEHEMSSCEPCYSWNVFHSWQLGDRERFLEGMYSLFAGAVSRQTRISCETRGGITGNVFAAPLAIYLARLSVIDEQLTPAELQLLRLMPLAWLAPGKAAIFRQIPTEYGPVTVDTTLSSDRETMQVTYQPSFRSSPSKIWLHIPPVQGLKLVKVNGKSVWSGGARVVALGNEPGVKSSPGTNP
jgi:hypothetical protein